MEIKVTCAAKSTVMIHGQEPDFVVPKGASVEETQLLYMKAAELAVNSHRTVYVEY